ncbi:MAG: hypothetical protein K2X27_00010 [Candidatus Obscuribacterales bacterium]|nr:hypothetical protein [Candidatus Obscuribacterales bacterium]
MKFTVLFILTAILAFRNPLIAALLWTGGIAFFHMLEEAQGRLWAYFGELLEADWLRHLSAHAGLILIVWPAFVLQAGAAYGAFSAAQVNPFWLSLLIGARIGDGLFSHFIPFAQGFAAPRTGKVQEQLNPGLATAVVYLVDSLLLALLFNQELLSAASGTVLAGAALGAGFFALVQPGLKLASRFVRA